MEMHAAKNTGVVDLSDHILQAVKRVRGSSDGAGDGKRNLTTTSGIQFGSATVSGLPSLWLSAMATNEVAKAVSNVAAWAGK